MGLVADGGVSRTSAARKEGPHPACYNTSRYFLTQNKTNYYSVLSLLYFLNQFGSIGTTGTNWYTCTTTPCVIDKRLHGYSLWSWDGINKIFSLKILSSKYFYREHLLET